MVKSSSILLNTWFASAHRDELSAMMQSGSAQDLIAAGYNSNNPHDRVAMLDATASQLEAKFKDSKKANPITSADLELIQNLIDAVDKQFIPELTSQSDADKSHYSAQLGKHSKCITRKQSRFATSGEGNDVAVAWHDSSASALKHKKCRKLQKSVQVYTDYADVIGQKGNFITLVKTEAPDDLWQAHANIVAAVSTFNADKVAYKNTPPQDTSKIGISDSCDEDQLTYETNFCFWRSLKMSACREFRDCIATVDLAGLKNETLTKINARKHLHFMLNKLKCKLGKIKVAFDTPSNASSTHVGNCSSVEDIPDSTYGFNMDVPNVVFCHQDSNITTDAHPSTTDVSVCGSWTDAQYGWAATHVQPSICKKTCTLPVDGGSGGTGSVSWDNPLTTSGRCRNGPPQADLCDGGWCYTERGALYCNGPVADEKACSDACADLGVDKCFAYDVGGHTTLYCGLWGNVHAVSLDGFTCNHGFSAAATGLPMVGHNTLGGDAAPDEKWNCTAVKS